MIKTYKAEGVVLARRNIGEADRLVTVLTKQYGKKVLKAAGIRRIHSRRSPHLEVFAQVTLVLHPGRTFDVVSEVSPLNNFSFIRTKLERVGFAYIALEIVNRMLVESQETVSIYLALLTFLQKLNDPAVSREVAYRELESFKKFTLSELGFITKEQQTVPLDETIEDILESRLKSPFLLTRIQTSV